MTEHTPGPWDLHHQSPEFRGGDCDWSLQTEEAGAFLLFCHHPKAPAEANARLIAAAPDMLACLQEIVAYRGGAESALDDPYVMERVNDAIAKATQVSPSSAVREVK